ncbi:uncharacterized protein LOC108471540 [Gossypium arboreum]|uniref:uncharacterized protein LOC108471540 n=1 Tax=Gossypium arboreum TaxID=29729 RepID=UPI0008196D54|nr:uncharacterized protein LOC108471540 [Gossypium arboreum]
MVATEYERCVRFEVSLGDNLRVLIAQQRERGFSLLVEKAKITEEVKHAERQNHDKEKDKKKRDSESSSTMQRPKKKARSDGLLRAGPPITATRLQPCVNCGLSVESTSSEVTVLSPLGQFIRVSKLFRNVPLEVQRAIFFADLMELPFREFDLVLGMDCLVKHCVTLDYATKRVVLRTEDDDEVIIVREHWNYLANVIFVLVAEKLVRKGCEAYLAYLPALPLNREVEFGIELFPSTAPVSIAPYQMALKEHMELKA